MLVGGGRGWVDCGILLLTGMCFLELYKVYGVVSTILMVCNTIWIVVDERIANR